MKNFVKISLFICSFFISLYASAAIIHQQLDEADYISFGGYDWAWASPFGVQFIGDSTCDIFAGDFEPDNYLTTKLDGIDNCGNQLFAPWRIEGWDFIENQFIDNPLYNATNSINSLMLSLYNNEFNTNETNVLNLFDVNGKNIRAFDFWNTIQGLTHFDENLIGSQWNEPGKARIYDFNDNPFGINPYLNTIYVRVASEQLAPEAEQAQAVPEPAPLLFLSLAMVLLLVRQHRRTS
jgi:hypothetical protein